MTELPQARDPQPEIPDCKKGKIFFPLLDNGDGNVKRNFFMCHMAAFRERELQMEPFSDSLAPRARNRAATTFLLTDCEYLFFIDADIVFSKENVDFIMESQEPIVAGLYCKKEKGIAPCLNTFPDMKPTPCGGHVEIKRAGTGFIRIHREVLEKMKPRVKRYTNHGREEWEFFPVGVVGDEYLSEDWYFCDIARELGYKIQLDTRIQLRHEGSALYPLDDAVKKIQEENNGCVIVPDSTSDVTSS